MGRLLALAVLALAAAMLASPARTEPRGTTLSLQARWDHDTTVQGTVFLSRENVSGPNTVIATETLSRGRSSVTVPLAANSLYNVTLNSANGTQLASFPITTALINPSNLASAAIEMVVHVADNTLASARIQVSLNF